MYKGKFDQKNKGTTQDVHELVTQRNTAPAKKPVAEKDIDLIEKQSAPKKASAKEAPVTETPVKEVPAKKQAKKKQPEEAPEKKRKGPRLGGVIFYTLYFLFILVFFIGTYIGLQWLNGWLADYELAQPTVKAEQVFTQLFTDPNWGDLYDAAGAEDSVYEGKEEYVTYMEAKAEGTPLTYLETSAGLSDDKKYVVRLGDENVATFTLVDKNALGEASLENIGGELPDWQLGSVEVFFDRPDSYLIEKLDGHVVHVNGVALNDDHTIQIATTLAQSYLPSGTTGASMCTQQVTGLMCPPEVSVFDEKGNPMEVTYDEATRTFTERTVANTITPEQEEVSLNAAKAFCLWMIEEGNRADIAKYYDASYQVYKDIIRTTELWMQNHGGYEFKNDSVTDFASYSDSIFSVRVSTTLAVKRTDGTSRDYDYSQSLFFHKADNGAWKVFDRTNVDVSQPVGKVRLTFMYNGQQLMTDMYQTDADKVITPVISPAPAGKVFSGWASQTRNAKGDTVMTIVFRPDAATGEVLLPDGNVLEPMTLHAVFQNPEDVTEAPAETTPAETAPAETTEGA